MAIAADKDRRSNMATSSVNAPMKKGGAGGSYTWGGIMDVTDYQPVGVTNATKVVVAPAVPMQVAAPVAATMPAQTMVSISDASHFPALSSAPPLQRTIVWGAPAPAVQVAAPTRADAIVSENNVRQGVTFDATHPRHQFAKKPSTSNVIATDAQPALAIDWSQVGTQAVQQTMLHVAANPVVLGPAVTQHPAVPLDVLRAQPQPVPIQPKVMKGAYPSKPQFQRPMVLQGRGR